MQTVKDRDYLMKLEKLGEGKINWDVWDKLVLETRKQLGNLLDNTQQPKQQTQGVIVYAYNFSGKQIHKFNSNLDCAKFLNANVSTIHKYSLKNYIYNDLLLSREKLSKDVAFAMYRFALEHGRIYKSNITVTKPKKTLYNYNNKGEMVGVFESLQQYCKCHQSNGLTILRKRLLKGDIITKGKLLSYSFYDGETALEQFNLLSQHTKVILNYNIYFNGKLIKENAKPKEVIEKINISYSALKRKLSDNDYFYWFGYIVSKTELSTLDILRITQNHR